MPWKIQTYKKEEEMVDSGKQILKEINKLGFNKIKMHPEFNLNRDNRHKIIT